MISEKNILSVSDDDRLSINDEITERIPRFNTKELFYPSTNNLFPFVGAIQPSTFSLFFWYILQFISVFDYFFGLTVNF